MAASFGVLLRQHRVARTLTQERLAERASVSATAIAALEAGRRTAPRLSTISLLADALELDDDDRAALASAAAPQPTAPTAAPIARTPAIDFPGVMRQYAFVGRPRERAALDGAWERSVRVVLVSGEAGAGKTRLVGEFASAASAHATALWGRCTPDRLGAYEPFVEPIRAAVRACGGDLDVAVLSELERIVPELVAQPGRTTGPSVADPAVERRLLFDAVTTLMASSSRTLLVLDDVQWADRGSLALLTHLAASPASAQLTIVGIVRSTDLEPEAAATLGELRRRATLERVTLTGLDDDDVATLVRNVAGRDASTALIDTVTRATEGNPLFVAELTEHLLEHEWLPDASALDDRRLPVPIGVRETLVQRLATLSDSGVTLVRAGAVLGRTFDVDRAADIGGLEHETVAGATEDALLSGLVVETSARAVSFSHALVQSAVYESISARRRIDLHRRAAQVLAAMAPARHDDATTFDVARHWTVVADADDTAVDEAVRWAMRAGDAAAGAADMAEAIRRYEWAERRAGPGTTERLDTLLRLGAAHSARSEATEADTRFWAALALADALGDTQRAADAAIGLAATVRFGRHDPARIDALERVLRELPDDDVVRRAKAASMLKRQLGFDDSEAAYVRRQAAAAMVLDALSPETPSRAILIALGATRDSIVVDDPAALARVSESMVAIAIEEHDLVMLANAQYGAAWAALELADGPGWHRACAAFSEVARELDLPYELSLAARMDALTALMEGRFDDARRVAQQSLELAAGVDPNAGAIALTNDVLRAIDCGDASDALEVMLAARAELDGVPTFVAGLAITAAFGGAPAVAREILDTHAATSYANVRRDLEWLPVIGMLCHACIALGATEYAGALHEVLASHSARAVRVGPLAAFWGPTDYHLGALAHLLGRTEEAERRLRDAVDTCAALGARPWTARSQLALADVLAARDTANDEVTALRASARTLASEVGAVGIQP